MHSRNPGLCRAAAVLAFALALLQATPAAATIVFAEDFESGLGLADGNWSTVGTATISNVGYASAHGVTFTTKTAAANLYSSFINVSSKTYYYITVDFKESGAGGWVRVEGFNAGGASKQKITAFADSTASPKPKVKLNAPGSAYVRYTYSFKTGSSVKQVKLEFADETSNATVVGHVFFDNIQLSTTPAVPGATPDVWREVVK